MTPSYYYYYFNQEPRLVAKTVNLHGVFRDPPPLSFQPGLQSSIPSRDSLLMLILVLKPQSWSSNYENTANMKQIHFAMHTVCAGREKRNECTIKVHLNYALL